MCRPSIRVSAAYSVRLSVAHEGAVQNGCHRSVSTISAWDRSPESFANLQKVLEDGRKRGVTAAGFGVYSV